MRLKVLFARLRASLGFGSFRARSFVTQAKLNDRRRELRHLTFLKGEVTWNQIKAKTARMRRGH